MTKETSLVYSTDKGRIKPQNQTPEAHSTDGIVRIRRETKGRNGKGVTTVTGIPLNEDDLKALAKKIKQLCGTGGSVKNGVIEIQGDKREKIEAFLKTQGFTTKLAGG